jgi:hypothetical protein
MNLIWSMMNTLQIIIYIPLMNIRFPQNAFVLSIVLMTLATFDFIPHEGPNKYMLEYDPENEITNPIYAQVGFETNSFILNAGTLFWMIVIYFLGIIVVIGLKMT